MVDQLSSYDPTDPNSPNYDPNAVNQSVDPGVTPAAPIDPNQSIPVSTPSADAYGLGDVTSVGKQPPPAQPPAVTVNVQQAPAPGSQPAAPPQPPVQRINRTSVPGASNSNTPALGGQAYLNASADNTRAGQDIVRQQGEQAQQTGNDLYFKQQEMADEKLQQQKDFEQLYQTHLARHQEDSQRLNSAYADYAAKAATLKDPTNQYYADHGGFAGRLAAGLAAFGSGLGAGLLGKAGNPFMDYLNNHIQQNFEAHKQNIRDLYDKQVAAGKIMDSNQNWNTYESEAKLKSYELNAANYINQLSAIKDQATGQNTKLLADRTINDMKQSVIDKQHELSVQQAAQAAQARAQQRADEKEARETFGKTYQEASKEYSHEDALQHAFDATVGFSNQTKAAIARDVGYNYNSKTDKFEPPKDNTNAGSLGTHEVQLDSGEIGRARNDKSLEKVLEMQPAQRNIRNYSDKIDAVVAAFKRGETPTNEQLADLATAASIAKPSWNAAMTGNPRPTSHSEGQSMEGVQDGGYTEEGVLGKEKAAILNAIIAAPPGVFAQGPGYLQKHIMPLGGVAGLESAANTLHFALDNMDKGLKSNFASVKPGKNKPSSTPAPQTQKKPAGDLNQILKELGARAK